MPNVYKTSLGAFMLLFFTVFTSFAQFTKTDERSRFRQFMKLFWIELAVIKLFVM